MEFESIRNHDLKIASEGLCIDETSQPSCSKFVTVSEARAKLDELVASSIDRHFSITIASIAEEDIPASRHWRIGVSINLPRYANKLFGCLANMGLPGSRRRIEFVLKAEAEALITDAGPKHRYTVLNGSFQRMSMEMKTAKPFRDRELRPLYGIAFESTDFERVLAVVLSELSGQPAFPEKAK